MISQYANKPTLNAIVKSFADAMDLSGLNAQFIRDIWDFRTATGIGLDIWGRIVGVNRYVTVNADNNKYFGFGAGTLGFNGTFAPVRVYRKYFGFNSIGFNGTFAPMGQRMPELLNGTTHTVALSDDQYRNFIIAKIFRDNSDSSIASLNQALKLMFPDRGDCYVIVSKNMTLLYKFGFALTPVEEAIIGSGILQSPAGFKVYTMQNNITGNYFFGGGFAALRDSNNMTELN